MRLLILVVCAAAMACAPNLKSYRPETMARDEGAVVGHVKVVYNGEDLTSKCAVCFRSVNGPCYSLDETGYVAMALQAGSCSIRRIACNAGGERHFHFKGYAFDVAPRAKTYFGDVTIEWKNGQGFKPSQLFGLAGAIVDQSINDGDAKLSVTSAREGIVAWYKSLGKRDSLPLRDSLVTFRAAPVMLAKESCAPLIPALVAEDANVLEKPDGGSLRVTTVPAETPVCAGTAAVGYGFRRIKSPSGVEGYVSEDSLSHLSP